MGEVSPKTVVCRSCAPWLAAVIVLLRCKSGGQRGEEFGLEVGCPSRLALKATIGQNDKEHQRAEGRESDDDIEFSVGEHGRKQASMWVTVDEIWETVYVFTECRATHP